MSHLADFARPLAGLSLGVILSVAEFACHSPAILGEACASDAGCVSGLCAFGACTEACSSQAECPVGFDCRMTPPDGGTELLCTKSQYLLLDAGGFGTNCTAASAGCTDAGSPCGDGLTCYSYDDVQCDPQAYCTSTKCQTNLDCPPTMMCGSNQWTFLDGGTGSFNGCLTRQRCDPCETDDECPTGLVCAHDNIGGRFCGQPCSTTDDCLKPDVADEGTKTYGDFETCQTDKVSGKSVCTPGTGACHGKSALPQFTGDGQICSPCRAWVPSDCSKHGEDADQPLQCIEEYTGERWCTEGCQVTLTFDTLTTSWRISGDPCPAGTTCYFDGEAPEWCYDIDVDAGTATPLSSCTGYGWCNAASDYIGDTCYPTAPSP